MTGAATVQPDDELLVTLSRPRPGWAPVQTRVLIDPREDLAVQLELVATLIKAGVRTLRETPATRTESRA